MTTKVRIKIGAVEIEYDGPEAFLEKKLPDLVSQLSSMAETVDSPGDTATSGVVSPGTLPALLKAKNVSSNQNKRFLATAEWLHLKGVKQIKTGDVVEALRENHQSKLGNPSQCLNSNVSSGFCEKVGKEFFVTDDGRNSL